MSAEDNTTTQHKRNTLRKSAKLRHRTLVQDLFQKGKNVYAGHLRATFRTLSEEELQDSFREAAPDRMGPVQIMVTVPKKKRRHAVDRVLMRRRIREAYRLGQHELRRMVEEDPEIRTLSLAFVYMHTENDDYARVKEDVDGILRKIRKKLANNRHEDSAAALESVQESAREPLREADVQP